ncbi:MAG: FAD-binding oxidoreductase [Chloroflexota bacterium]|nr:FAD-binding oxidoreductase [Chloroflexota bacterium]
MTETAGVVVIGGGCIGTSIALHLAKAGVRDVLLVERAHLCAGTTGQSGAIVRQHYSNDFTAAMARDSLQIFREWADRIGGGDPGFTESGVLVTVGEADTDGLRANVAMQQGIGIDTRIVTPDEMHALDPRLRVDDIALGCWEPTAGYADPVATVHAYANAARAAGVTIREGVEVLEVLREGDRAHGVRTNAGEIAAPIVVNAGNIWGVALLRQVGLDLPIAPSRHPMAALRRPDDARAPHAVILDMHRNAYLLPHAGDVTLCGSIAGEDDAVYADPNTYNQGVTRAEIERFQAEGAYRLPALARSVAQGGWAGIYDGSADHHPVLDAVPGIEGYYCAVGFSGHGFKLSPVFGALMANLITDGPQAAPALYPFRATRWAENDPIGTQYTAGVLA